MVVAEPVLFVLVKVDLDPAVDLLDEELANVPHDPRSRRSRVRDDVEIRELFERALDRQLAVGKGARAGERDLRDTYNVGDGSFDRLVNDPDLLVEVRRVTPRLERDDAVPERVNDPLERLDVAVSVTNRRNVQPAEGPDSVDEVAILGSDVRNSDRANRQEDLARARSSRQFRPAE